MWLRGAVLALVLGVGLAVIGMGRGGEPEAAVVPGLFVETAPAEAQRGYDETRRFVGRVEFARSSEVSFEVGGQVARVLVDEGDVVAAGDVLAELDTARLRARRAELAAARDEARARNELALLRDGRSRELLGEDVISPQQADDTRLEVAARAASLRRVEAQVSTVEVDLEKSVLRAPFAGEITKRLVDPGVVVHAGAAVLRLLETSRPEVRVGVSSEVARSFSPGDPVEVTIGGDLHRGAVLAVLRERGRLTRTVPVRIALEPGGPTLREGDLAELVRRRPVESPGFWLPRSALSEGTRGLWAAYVAGAESVDPDAGRVLERRPVEVLHEAGERVYVRGALRDGEAVVQDGVHRLVPGQLVRIDAAPKGAHTRVDGAVALAEEPPR